MTSGKSTAQLDEAIRLLQNLRDSISEQTPIPSFESEQARIRSNYPMDDRHWTTEGGEKRLRAVIHWVEDGSNTTPPSQQSVFAGIDDPEALIELVLEKLKSGREQGYKAISLETGPYVMPVRLSAEGSEEQEMTEGKSDEPSDELK